MSNETVITADAATLADKASALTCMLGVLDQIHTMCGHLETDPFHRDDKDTYDPLIEARIQINVATSAVTEARKALAIAEGRIVERFPEFFAVSEADRAVAQDARA